jgi:hypothetical protein
LLEKTEELENKFGVAEKRLAEIGKLVKKAKIERFPCRGGSFWTVLCTNEEKEDILVEVAELLGLLAFEQEFEEKKKRLFEEKGKEKTT